MNKKYPFFFNREPIKFISEFQRPKKGSFKCRSKYLNGMTDVKLEPNKNEFKITFEDFLTSKNGKSLLRKIKNN